MSQTTWFAKIERNRGNWHVEASKRKEISQPFLPEVDESYLSLKKEIPGYHSPQERLLHLL